MIFKIKHVYIFILYFIFFSDFTGVISMCYYISVQA